MRLLTIISGAMLIITGLFCYANPGETFLALAFILGLAMILTGVIQVVAYWWGRDNRHDNNGWIFADALLTLILGILVITSLIAADAAIPMVFGMWVMASGILRFVVATTIDPKTKKKNFVWTMLTGLISVGAGLYAFLNPYVADLNIAILLGLLFMIQGICTMELGIHMPHEKKEKVAKPKAKMIKIQIKKPIKKKEKKVDLFAAIPPVELNTEDIKLEDIERFKTEEIKLDDIRAALEFNLGAANEPEIETETETVAEAEQEQAAESEAVSEETVTEETVEEVAEEPAAEETVEEPVAEETVEEPTVEETVTEETAVETESEEEKEE